MPTLTQDLTIRQTIDLPTDLLAIFKKKDGYKASFYSMYWKNNGYLVNADLTRQAKAYFLFIKKEVIGLGSIQQSPTAPPTTGIGFLQNCYILEKERRKGYGNQLYQHLLQFAKIEFGQLQINESCPYYKQLGPKINLMDY